MLRNFLKLAIILFFLFLLFTLASIEILASIIVGKYASFTFVVYFILLKGRMQPSSYGLMVKFA